MPSRLGASARRSGAGDASRAAAVGRSRKNRAAPDCAARLRRRSASDRTACCQSSTAPHVPARSACSAAQRASAVRGAFRFTNPAGSTPQYASAAGCSRWGGWTMTTGFGARRASTGASNRSSPMPGCCASSSTRQPGGQPPPGSSADSAAWPVSIPREPACANWLARHKSGWMRSGWARAGCMVFVH